jgi:hypothetical protein
MPVPILGSYVDRVVARGFILWAQRGTGGRTTVSAGIGSTVGCAIPRLLCVTRLRTSARVALSLRTWQSAVPFIFNSPSTSSVLPHRTLLCIFIVVASSAISVLVRVGSGASSSFGRQR